MATRIFTGFVGATAPGQIALEALENFIMTRAAQLNVQDGIGVIGQGGGHRLAIAGDIAASEQGISLTGYKNQVTITSTGSILSGASAIAIGGNDMRVVNYGHLTSLAEFAISLTNVASTDVAPTTGLAFVFNAGVIRGGISSTGNFLSVHNSGLIVGLEDYAPGPLTIRGSSLFDYVYNTGTIQGTVDMGGGSDKLINRGTIDGYVGMGAGDDIVDNRLGNIFQVSLEEGNDTYRPGADVDFAFGGAGIDTLDFARSGPITFALDGSVSATGVAEDDTIKEFENLIGSSTGNDMLIGDLNDNTIDGRGGNDELLGGLGKDTLIGGSGNDTLRGDTGDDILNGGIGFDTLVGGAGADTLTGGIGADSFAFGPDAVAQSALSAVSDVIKDFSATDGDIINLSAIDAKVSSGVNDSFTWIASDKFHKQAGELRYVNTASGILISGDVTGDGISDFFIKLAGFSGNPIDNLVL